MEIVSEVFKRRLANNKIGIYFAQIMMTEK